MTETSKILDYRDPEWVGKRLGLDKNTVYKFLQDGVIPAVHLGRKWLISEARLAVWLEKEAENQTRARREAAQSSDRAASGPKCRSQAGHAPGDAPGSSQRRAWRHRRRHRSSADGNSSFPSRPGS